MSSNHSLAPAQFKDQLLRELIEFITNFRNIVESTAAFLDILERQFDHFNHDGYCQQ